MNTHCSTPQPEAVYELRFPSLFNEGRALTFPCDARGQVDMDRLPDRARNNYFRAHMMIGREFATPQLLPTTPQ
jgi:hypothetical protein